MGVNYIFCMHVCVHKCMNIYAYIYIYTYYSFWSFSLLLDIYPFIVNSKFKTWAGSLTNQTDWGQSHSTFLLSSHLNKNKSFSRIPHSQCPLTKIVQGMTFQLHDGVTVTRAAFLPFVFSIVSNKLHEIFRISLQMGSFVHDCAHQWSALRIFKVSTTAQWVA